MAFTKIPYSAGDVLTSEQVNKMQDAIVTAEGNIEAHFEKINNPHNVTLAQLGVTVSAEQINALANIVNGDEVSY